MIKKYLVTIVLAIIFLTACSSKEELPEYHVLEEYMTPESHYRLIEVDGEVRIYNVRTGKLTPYIRNPVERALPVPYYYTTDFQTDYTPYNLKEEYDYTYSYERKELGYYYRKMLNGGWKVIQLYRNNQYIDIYLSREKESIRLVIYPTYIKIFPKYVEIFKYNLPYINGKGEEL